MRAAQLRICTVCPLHVTYAFTVHGTDQLEPKPIRDVDLADYLRDGWTATYHDHAGPRPPIN